MNKNNRTQGLLALACSCAIAWSMLAFVIVLLTESGGRAHLEAVAFVAAVVSARLAQPFVSLVATNTGFEPWMRALTPLGARYRAYFTGAARIPSWLSFGLIAVPTSAVAIAWVSLAIFSILDIITQGAVRELV